MYRLVVAVLALLAASPAALAATNPMTGSYIAGDSVLVDQPLSGTPIVAGGSVRITAPVTGDLVVTGGEVQVEAPVSGNLFIAAGDVRVTSTIGRNVYVAGGNVELSASSIVGESLQVVGGNVRQLGTVRGNAGLRAGAVLIAGRIAGNAVVETRELRFQEGARIEGDLRGSGVGFDRAAAAPYVGGTIHMGSARTGATPWAPDGERVQVLGLLMSLVTAFFLMLLAPALPAVALRRFARRPFLSWVTGLLTVLAFFPILLLFVTVIAAPVAGIALVIWAVVVLLTKIFLALILGESLLRALRVRPTMVRRLIAVLIALFVLATLGTLPYVSVLVWLVLFPMALGASVLAVPGVLRVDRALVPVAVGEPMEDAPAAPVRRRAPAKKVVKKPAARRPKR